MDMMYDPLEPAVMLWLDCEFDSLELGKARILEVSCVATDGCLKSLGEPFSEVSSPADFREEDMEQHIRSMHHASGLLSEIRRATLSERDLEAMILSWIDNLAGKSPVVHCGYYIQADREIMQRVMPRLYCRLGFRQLDLRSLEEAADAWVEHGRFARDRRRSHRALSDVEDAIALARLYRERYFGLR